MSALTSGPENAKKQEDGPADLADPTHGPRLSLPLRSRCSAVSARYADRAQRRRSRRGAAAVGGPRARKPRLMVAAVAGWAHARSSATRRILTMRAADGTTLPDM